MEKEKIMCEIWEDIPGYKGYQASNLGRIKSLDRMVGNNTGKRLVKERILKSCKNSDGYLHVSLRRHSARVHQLILLTFVGTRPDGMVTRHGPNGKLDNSLKNLCYGTRSENRQDQKRDGTDGSKVVCRSDGRKFCSIREAERQTGIYQSNIIACCCGKLKSAGGFNWSYENAE